MTPNPSAAHARKPSGRRTRATEAAISTDVREVRIRPPEVGNPERCRLCRRQRRHVDVARHDDLRAAQPLVGHRDRCASRELALDLHAALPAFRVLDVRIDRCRSRSRCPRETSAARAGRPALRLDQMTGPPRGTSTHHAAARWTRLAAECGRRTCPNAPRTTVRRLPGAHATPTSRRTLFQSVCTGSSMP